MMIEDIINKLKFEPVNRYTSCGNEIQLCKTKHKKIEIYERTFFPWSPFNKTTIFYFIDLTLPMNTTVPNGKMSDNFYTEDGLGLPIFDELTDVITFIENYKTK